MTNEEAATVVAMLIAAYPRPEVSDVTAEIYQRMLLDLDFESAQEAAARLITTSKWLPTVAEIRSAALDATHGPARLGGEAWGDVVRAIRFVGSHREAPSFRDPGVAQCVRMLGWRELCLGRNEAADRARFIELYDGLQARGRLDVASGRPLPSARSYVSLPASNGQRRRPLSELRDRQPSPIKQLAQSQIEKLKKWEAQNG